MINNPLPEYTSILRKFMSAFGLYSIDITKLLSSTKDIIEDLDDAKNGPTLRKLESIANIFGLRYYQLGNPENPIPLFDDLPIKTKEKINWRKKKGAPDSKEYNRLDLNKIVLAALEEFRNKEEFLPTEIYEVLSDDLKKKLGSASRITGLFSDELKSHVEKTGNKVNKKGPGRREEYYRVISLES